MRNLASLALALAVSTAALAQTTAEGQHVTKLAEGVYAIVHDDAPDGNPNGNTTVIIGDRDVLVVDSDFALSMAKADIALIRTWTDKPVRYLLNTHRTNDHNMGNALYKEAFPAMDVIAHWETKRGMYRAPVTPERFEHYVAIREERIRSGKNADGRPLTDEEMAATKKSLEAKKRMLAEFREYHYLAPTITFDEGMDVDLGNRIAQIRFFGPGVTPGDAVVYLPKERILASGELVTHPAMYTFGGYPSEWVRTLERISRLDIEAIVPAHGDVLRGKPVCMDFLALEREYLQSAVDQVHAQLEKLAAVSELPPLADVRKGVDLSPFRTRFAGADKEQLEFFDGASEALIRVTYDEEMHNAVTPR
jgi:glyoxylase-like metal-dependent hydrolase (beta-lactamase superfamily II)